ncbi:TadE/TadG family type IV pilus assembly protein [Massilia sp. CF038]|uniref:TadE/TadG family type IV pilus assembly protein n=1 Tax=Massilia sp. CF038 TaxID=1881045 RepID=UPI000920641A|nr:TadE family protein [Massilia sp. CF038]SHH24920.1 TadE-like protein [Massilia sp. CF038]
MKLHYGAAQRGQAMVEMAAIAGLVVLIFLGIWYLGKFHDIQATTIQAARYAAWERTVRPTSFSDRALEEQMRARLFSWNDQAYRSNDRVATNGNWGQQNDVWRDHADDERLIDRPRDVTVSTSNNAIPGRLAGGATKFITGVSSGVGAVTNGEGLPPGGMMGSQVSVRLQNLSKMPAPMNALNLTLSETSTVVADSWDASGQRQVAMRTRSFSAAGVLSNLTTVLRPATAVLSAIEPAFRDFHPGEICPDVVPVDRVQGGRVLPAYNERNGCF